METPNKVNIIFSRDKMIEQVDKILKKHKMQSCNSTYPECVEELADVILKSGLPEKKDIEEMIAKLPFGKYTIVQPHNKDSFWWVFTNDKDYSGSTLTEAITNYYNEITK